MEAKKAAYIIQSGNRFTPWAVNIVREILKTEPDARIWIPFSGTTLGYDLIRDEVEGMPNVLLSWESKEVHERIELNGDWQFKYKELRSRLKPGAFERIIMADRFYGNAYVETADFEVSGRLVQKYRDVEFVKRFLVTMLSWLFEHVDRYEPKAIMCYCVAGAMSMSLWEIADASGVPFRTLDGSRVDGFHHFGVSPFNTFESIAREYRRLEDRSSAATADEIQRAKDVLEGFRNAPENGQDWKLYADKLQQLTLPKILRAHIRHLLTFWKWTSNVEYLPGAFEKINLDTRAKLLARRHIKKSDFKKLDELPEKFVYVPLHTDPEASTMVFEPYIQNQAYVIENLVRSFGLDFPIVVKEHLITLGWRRDSFYRHIKKYPNVFIVSPLLSGPQILEKCTAVSTITGTSGWQGLILGKPVITFGRPYYEPIGEGFIRLNGWNDLAEKWSGFTATFRRVPDAKLLNWIVATFRASFNLTAAEYWAQSTPETCIKGCPKQIQIIADELRGIRSQPVLGAARVGAETSYPLV